MNNQSPSRSALREISGGPPVGADGNQRVAFLWRTAYSFVLTFALLGTADQVVAQTTDGRIPSKVRSQLEREEPANVLVHLAEDVALLPESGRKAAGTRPALRRAIKEQMLTALVGKDLERLKTYDQLPMLAVRVRNIAALERLAARSEVLEIYEDIPLYAILSQSLPLIGQPTASAAAQQGSGTAIAVLDTGVDYTNAQFGSCTAPGTPAGCKVAVALDTAPDDGVRDANGHGSMVAGIASATAPAANIIALDVFDGSSASSVDVVDAINWVIANRTAYNITAINMSLGGSTKYTSTCTAGNPFRVAIQAARADGIVSFVASGNDGYPDGISMPACTSGAVAVGAVYDANVGNVNWGVCSDSTTSADKVACFSNSASMLALLAPGALISVLGSSGGGTSFAAPHAAGAYAVLRGARPAEASETALARLSNYGVAVTDSRNGFTFPRINLVASLQLPANDLFAAATVISGSSGSVFGNSELSTAEASEPAHAGVSPNRSVWWKWTAPAGGDATFTTSGSGFDTVLAAYTGSAVGALASVATNNNESGTVVTSKITFRALAGTTYYLAVAGNAGATGAVSLNWSLVEPVADLSVTLMATPDPAVAGSDITYTATVTNNGPYMAESVLLNITLPVDATVRSASSGCTVAVGAVACVLGNMTVAQSLTRQVVVLAAAAGSLTLSASVDGAWSDLVASNDSASGSVVVVAAPSSDNGDVPLPAWSLLLMVVALWRGVVTSRR
ncbi:MAG: S8 family serine peptidase [Azonexus sp.]|nr:S8 family serine peptidase [Azonexus sp.]